MIIRLVLKKPDGTFKTQDLSFNYTTNEMMVKTYFCDHLSEKEIKFINECEAVGVEIIKEEHDKC